MRTLFSSVALGSLLAVGLSGNALLAQDQSAPPAASAPSAAQRPAHRRSEVAARSHPPVEGPPHLIQVIVVMGGEARHPHVQREAAALQVDAATAPLIR